MVAFDPAPSVATPTGALQGVAAFSWDGTNWQPTGRAGASVATSTGVLQGVAPFSYDGASWQPVGRAQSGVPTPTGVLDGVAVYTWSGSAWTPTGGQPTPSTPTGALRGVAAFNWDGSAWQPVGQAGPSVATPYGVLAGVAMFGWTGSAWTAVAGPSLDLSFMAPGALDARLTFTRASTATYTNAAGTVQAAATNAPRWDYDISTHVLRGLLLEDAATNLLLQSADVSNAAWLTQGVGATGPPVITGNNATAPDGTLTAARAVFPAVPSGANMSAVFQGFSATASTTYTCSIYLRGNVGGEQVYLGADDGAGHFWNGPLLTLTTAWQRYILTGAPPSTGSTAFKIGNDQRVAGQGAITGGTVYVWGGQAEQRAFATSYIPTTTVTVTRAQDVLRIPPANMAFFASPGGSWAAEFILLNPANAAANPRIVGPPGAGAAGVIYGDSALHLAQYDLGAAVVTANSVVTNAITKGASTFAPGTGRVCLNGSTIASGGMSNGYAVLVSGGVGLMTVAPPGGSDNSSGYMRSLRYWPRVLSDAEMQFVTT